MAKIFFLEDDSTIREVLTEYMTVAGHEVQEFVTGDEAIAAQLDDFQMAILDIRVPGPDGIQVLKHIREKRGNGIGIIMLTAFDDVAMQIEAFNSFADDYITKPTSPIILLKRIEAVLRRLDVDLKVENRQDEELAIDEKGYRVFYKGEDISLTVSEFLLLKTLKNRPGMVFSREQLISAVFNDDYFGSDRIIDAHVKNIRKKLPINYIDTVIGAGYRWRDNK